MLSHTMKPLALLSIAATVLFIQGCGGGGGDTSPATAPLTQKMKQGFFSYQSNSFSGLTSAAFMMVLEDGETWITSLPGPNSQPRFFAQGNFYIASALTSSTTTISNVGGLTAPAASTSSTTATTSLVFESSSTFMSINSNQLAAQPIFRIDSSADQTSLVTVLPPGYSSPIATGYIETVDLTLPPDRYLGSESDRKYEYRYNNPASIQGVAGDFPGNPLSTAPSIVVSANGSLAGFNPISKCTYAGTLTPRPSGKNVFNLALTLSGCDDAGVYTGIGYAYTFTLTGTSTTPATTSQILNLAAMNTAKTKSFADTFNRAR